MSARYWVLCSDELMGTGRVKPLNERLEWPEGLRPVKRGKAEYGVPPYTPGAPQSSVAYAHWWLFEDDSADPSLEGTRVDLVIGNADGRVVIMGRVPYAG